MQANRLVANYDHEIRRWRCLRLLCESSKSDLSGPVFVSEGYIRGRSGEDCGSFGDVFGRFYSDLGAFLLTGFKRSKLRLCRK